MKDSSYGRLIAATFVAALLYIGHGLHTDRPVEMKSIIPNATAGVGVADEDSETLFTASADGRRIFMWQYYSSKPPKFLGESEANRRFELSSYLSHGKTRSQVASSLVSASPLPSSRVSRFLRIC